MGSALVDREGLAMDLGRLEMDRDSSDLVFVVGQDEAKVSGHAAIFSVRCTKFVDLVSNNNNNIKASHNQVSGGLQFNAMISNTLRVLPPSISTSWAVRPSLSSSTTSTPGS